jgi:hypothetical protein
MFFIFCGLYFYKFLTTSHLFPMLGYFFFNYHVLPRHVFCQFIYRNLRANFLLLNFISRIVAHPINKQLYCTAWDVKKCLKSVKSKFPRRLGAGHDERRRRYWITHRSPRALLPPLSPSHRWPCSLHRRGVSRSRLRCWWRRRALPAVQDARRWKGAQQSLPACRSSRGMPLAIGDARARCTASRWGCKGGSGQSAWVGLGHRTRRLGAHGNHAGILLAWHSGRQGRLKVHFPSCVVLVINDNPYGLIFLLSLIWRNRL